MTGAAATSESGRSSRTASKLIAAVNGCQKSLPQYPIDRLMLTMAAMIGKCFGEVLSIGDMGPTMRLRRMCAESFEAEMKKAVIRPLPMPGATEHMIDRTVGEQTAELMRKLKGAADA